MTLHIFTLSVEPRILKTRERKEKKEKKLSFSGSLPEVFYKKVFLKILQNSQENTCARASFLIDLQVPLTSLSSLNLKIFEHSL